MIGRNGKISVYVQFCDFVTDPDDIETPSIFFSKTIMPIIVNDGESAKFCAKVEVSNGEVPEFQWKIGDEILTNCDNTKVSYTKILTMTIFLHFSHTLIADGASG